MGSDNFILSVSENGYGKRSSYLDYRVTNRGGKGIIGIINSPLEMGTSQLHWQI